eukprot:5238325-Pleurochrysis_carterae.AAC.3
MDQAHARLYVSRQEDNTEHCNISHDNIKRDHGKVCKIARRATRWQLTTWYVNIPPTAQRSAKAAKVMGAEYGNFIVAATTEATARLQSQLTLTAVDTPARRAWTQPISERERSRSAS